MVHMLVQCTFIEEFIYVSMWHSPYFVTCCSVIKSSSNAWVCRNSVKCIEFDSSHTAPHFKGSSTQINFFCFPCSICVWRFNYLPVFPCYQAWCHFAGLSQLWMRVMVKLTIRRCYSVISFTRQLIPVGGKLLDISFVFTFPFVSNPATVPQWLLTFQWPLTLSPL